MSKDYEDKAYWNAMIKMSLSKLFILRALYDSPMHGYALSRKISNLTNGCCSPTEGALYPSLHEFEKHGYVTCRKQEAGGRTRKVYTLTEKGERACRAGLDAWEETAKALLAAKDELSA